MLAKCIAIGRCAELTCAIFAVSVVGCGGLMLQSCGGDGPDAGTTGVIDTQRDAGDAVLGDAGDAGGADHDAAPSPCGDFVLTPDAWTKRYGDDQGQLATGFAVDATGAALITGYYAGAIDFGGGPLSFAGVADGFITKIDSSGKHRWSRRVAGTGDDRALAVATDAACNVVVTGVFTDTVDFGGGPLVASGSWDVFVVKLDATGKHLWSKRFGNDEQQEGHALAIDAAGNIVLTGMFWGSIDFGGGPIATRAGHNDLFVAKLDPAGNHIWSKGFGSAADRGQDGRSVAVSSAGDVYVTGACAGTMDFGGSPLAAIGESDGFLLALDASGAHRWNKRWGVSNAYQGGASVTVDGTGDVVLAAYAEGSTDLGTGVLSDNGFIDVVLGKFSPAGTPIFARRFGSAANDYPASVATDASGSILVTGYTSGPIDFGNGPLTAGADRRAFIAKLDPTGVAVWSRAYGTSATGMGIAADPKANVFAAGTFTGSIDFGAGVVTNAGGEFGGEDVFLTKLAP